MSSILFSLCAVSSYDSAYECMTACLFHSDSDVI